MVKYVPGSTMTPEYTFIYPQDFGSWGEAGSDGYIWKGCMACHAENGAYRYAAYNSQEAWNGRALAATSLAFSPAVLETGAAKASTNAFKHSFKYAKRIRTRALQDPVGHNFPYSFDDVILKVKPITQADGSLLYRHAGHLNGKSGFYEIGLNPQTKTIFHRTFVGAK